MLLKPGLYIVSTPIGNLDDITIRALDVLKRSTVILCEDTRVSQKLLLKHNITQARLQVYNDHSDAKQRALVCALIDNGEIVSLISDAGTPLISDPGYKLIRVLRDNGYHIDILPGVSAPIAALTISGLPSDRFLFIGFLPKTTIGQQKIFTELLEIKATIIFFESAKRIVQSLSAAKAVLGNREAAVARELTKSYQDLRYGSLTQLIEHYQQYPEQLKGEIVLLVSGHADEKESAATLENLERVLKLYLTKGVTPKNATELTHTQFKSFYSKREIYSLANKIKQ
ncbi:Ribosomal RNA small subunit methyltransferase I [Candidatus Trichorickettsia mobilis]|uniref:Ribosomal RNA small subunit methyltransferase I n=1 Tax=Candidatus Trichorickettsia mobilis TaxID=1346319 RepID=A0ABZ0UWG3_9RICK|nr:16S rRNA (cytidine(1402)-2'-O)-methyltransferase [Candidatus Trichorickettsia mobilis]WPY00404.1 Ribosomal RNA small subunit methyltransferase I [Candidatus Trichorickettsia mobilis]